MKNTKKSFSDKWNKNAHLAFRQTLNDKSNINKWILKRNGWNNRQTLIKCLRNKRRILDAGCGNGRVTALLRECSSEKKTEIVGIDIVSHRIANHNLKKYNNVHFYKRDLLKDLTDLGNFDFIYCQEVLHHTQDPPKAFYNLVSLLSSKGEIAIYIYKKKAPVREYVDDYLRGIISKLSYKKAIKQCEEITKLGQILWNTGLKIKIPSIPALEIEKGRYDLQRFIYHFFMKCFWNPELSFSDNCAINYDWYHPQNASRHTLNEIRHWFKDAGLKIMFESVDFYGITIRGIKK